MSKKRFKKAFKALVKQACAEQLKITTFNPIPHSHGPIMPLTGKGKQPISQPIISSASRIKRQNSKKLPRENGIEKNERRKKRSP
jgi:hypothetical protein